jgi:hypothetical protein
LSKPTKNRGFEGCSIFEQPFILSKPAGKPAHSDNPFSLLLRCAQPFVSGEFKPEARKMFIYKYTVSRHAARRMAQRNLDLGDVAVVLRFGRREHCAGAEFFFLGERDLPAGSEKMLARLVGTVVVVVNDRIIATVYRNQKAISKIKHKPKRWRCERSDRVLAAVG